MSSRFNQYVDEYQNVHIQDIVLGQGGQGVVFRTKDPDLAIKIVTDESGNPVSAEESVERYSKCFKSVRLLPLPENLNISVPVALLRNNAGYVMQLLSEMIPFSHFFLDVKSAAKITSNDIPEWLSEMQENEAKKIVYYYKTGGLRRRLIALYKCASLLARLHGNGLIYGDISPNNIFISEGLEDSNVWLIDADNVRFEASTGGYFVYTPKYGAPELVQGKHGGQPACDCHSFAVVAFFLLSLIHPFIGKKVEGTEDSDWADNENDGEDIEEKAYAGFFPWVDDLKDDSNSSDSGLPRSLLLTKKMRTLFETTFGPGRIFPSSRPTIYHWPEALAQAADSTIKCPECSMSYFYDFLHPETNDHNCPYCKTHRPSMIILESYHWYGLDIDLTLPCWRFIREITNNSELRIPRRVFGDFTMTDSDDVEVIIIISSKDIIVKKSEHCNAELSIASESNQKNGFQKVYSQLKINRTTKEVRFWIFLHLDNPRLVLCSIAGGGE